MKIDNESVAVYSYIDYNELKSKSYPYHEALVPLKDLCEYNRKYTYNVYLDVEERGALRELLKDAKASKFESVIVINLKILANTSKEAKSIAKVLNSYGVSIKVINRNKKESKHIL